MCIRDRITIDDLKNYDSVYRKPLIGTYRDKKIISNSFAKYEIVNLTSENPRLHTLVEQYFEYSEELLQK